MSIAEARYIFLVWSKVYGNWREAMARMSLYWLLQIRWLLCKHFIPRIIGPAFICLWNSIGFWWDSIASILLITMEMLIVLSIETIILFYTFDSSYRACHWPIQPLLWWKIGFVHLMIPPRREVEFFFALAESAVNLALMRIGQAKIALLPF